MPLQQHIRKLFSRAVSALLCIVLAFDLGVNLIHSQIEGSEHASEQTCSVETESDACHRYLVHHEKSHACNGDHDHFSKKHHDCFICHFFNNHKVFFESCRSFAFISISSPDYYFFEESKSKSRISLITLLRGPPVIG